MPNLNRLLAKIDKFQQKHSPIAFVVAVIKKYGDDEAGHLCALITYYSFLSLLPLLLVTTTVLDILFKNHEHLKATVTQGVNHYFPVISSHFQSDIHTLHKTGLALIVGLLFTLYGAKGGADAIRYSLNRIWRVPLEKRPGFPQSIFSSLKLIIAGGGSLVITAILSSYATALTHEVIFRMIFLASSLALLVLAFFLIFKTGINSNAKTNQQIIVSASIAALGVQILQVLGGYLITHELKNLTNLYGAFALVLGILFWIYLQVQVLLFAAEVGAVRAFKLWPRSFSS